MAIYSRDLMAFEEYLGLARTQAGNSSISVLQNAIANVQLDRIASIVGKLLAEFDWAVGEILLRLDLQQKTFEVVLARIQAPLDTQAKELRRRAEYAYAQGWFDEALTDFLESEKKNYQDFSIYQAVANIYLYHREPPDLVKAREYYLKLSKYAAPTSAQIATLGYMYAGFACYLQKDDAAAIRYAALAAQTDPTLTEAFYNHAKFAAAADQAGVAIPSLEVAIRRDKNYINKIKTDSDFSRIEDTVSHLISKLSTSRNW